MEILFRYMILIIMQPLIFIIVTLLLINNVKIKDKIFIDGLIFIMILYIVNFIGLNYLFQSNLQPIISSAIITIAVCIASKIRLIGLTGGIACGKSLISQYAKEQYHIPIIDCDKIARDIVQIGKPAYIQIVQSFGPQILQPGTNEIDRIQLGNIIFSNPALRQKLNAITHKYIFLEILKQIYIIFFKQKSYLALLDAPLLFESRFLPFICLKNMVIFITNQQTQVDRLKKRDEITTGQALEKLHSQWSIQDKIKKADILLCNDGSVEQIQSAFQKAILPFLIRV